MKNLVSGEPTSCTPRVEEEPKYLVKVEYEKSSGGGCFELLIEGRYSLHDFLEGLPIAYSGYRTTVIRYN